MEHPYELYDAYISIDDIEIEKIGGVEDCTKERLKSLLIQSIMDGIGEGLKSIGIEKRISPVNVNVSVWNHDDGWYPCESVLPPYDETVLVCLDDGYTRVMTSRTKNDYSKDNYDFLHVSIARDAKYWMPIPSTPKCIKANYKLKEKK